MTTRLMRTAPVVILGILASAQQPISGQMQIAELNPTSSTLHGTDPNGASGGRVNALARGSATTFYAAGEWSGLHKSTDGGRTWARLDGHLPTATWDIEVSPADANRLVATSFYDGKVASLAGISLSINGGRTWTQPAGIRPAAAFCTDAARRDEPSAFGIAFDPETPANVYVGTNCGLAISNDAGATWRYVDPTPADPPDDIWDVIVHHGGIVDICGDDGHRRSTTGGTSWTTATSSPLPSGRCSLAVSPAESHVLFAVAGVLIFESDNGGASWTTRFTNRARQGRIPFVATNRRSGNAFDLWFGDTTLFRATCATPGTPAPGGNPRCPPSNSWDGPFTSSAGAHDDVGDIVFTPAAANACPVLFSSDGGVFVNSRTTSPSCHTPAWQQPVTTPKGLWLFGMSGARRPSATKDDLYLSAQDNGTFASTDGGATWKNIECCDSFDAVANMHRVLYTTCCFNIAPSNRLFTAQPGMVSPGQLPSVPPGELQGWLAASDIVDRWGAHAYVTVTSSGVFVTSNVSASPPQWTRLGTNPPSNACAVKAAGPETSPTFYVQAGACDGRAADALWSYNGTSATGAWRRLQPAPQSTGFVLFAAHRGDARRLATAQMRNAGPAVFFSTDGGTTWNANAALDTLMSGNGRFRTRIRRGPLDFTGFGEYVQPTLLAFDPADQQTILAGAADAGVFLSRDGGTNWTVVTDGAGTAGAPVLPRPSFAYFSRDGSTARVFIGTQGRGIWRVQYSLAPTTPPGPSPNPAVPRGRR